MRAAGTTTFCVARAAWKVEITGPEKPLFRSMIPYHVQSYPSEHDSANASFYKEPNGFSFKLVVDDEVLLEAGPWPTIGEADRAVRDLLPGLTKRPEVASNRNMLHLYIRHRRDAQSFDNDWSDDFRVRSIKTYEAVAQHCKSAQERGERIRVHRRKFERIPAAICCECSVKSVEPIEGSNGFKVEFQDWKSLSVEREKRLQQGYYVATPSNYEEAD